VTDFGPLEQNTGSALEADIQRLVDDVRDQTLSDLPGHFNRLIYLASLRDHNTGRYGHYGLELRFPSEAVQAGLRRCHLQAFEELVNLSLQEQTQDLIAFFTSLKTEPARLVEAWRRLRSYEILPPEDCHPLARQLFDKNVETILQVLRETELWDLLSDPHGDTHDLP
jgi:hypothetical protein